MFNRWNTPPIWQWWDRDFAAAPELIRYCHKTVKAHNDGVCLGIGYGALDGCTNLRPDHKSDFIRAEVLAKHRGIWLDVDYLCWGPIRTHINAWEFNVWRRDDGYLDNDFLAAPQYGNNAQANLFYEIVKERCIKAKWDSDKLESRGHIGADVLNELSDIDGDAFAEVDTAILCPYRRMVLNFDSYTDDEFAADPKTTGMMLLNSLLEPHVKNAPVKELAASQTVLGAVLRYADSRLPEHLRGFEV